MRYFLFFFLSLVLSNSFCQYSEYNKWSVDLSIGGTNAVEPYTPGYWSNTVDLVHTSGGVRYMFNNKFGLKLDGGYDLITNDNLGKNGNSLPFKTNYYRTSIQGVLDIGRIFTFENFTDRWSLLFHTGGGMSLTSSKVNPDTDRMVNFMFGFTPQFKLNDRIALNVDASFIWHIYQQYTFDMYNSVYNRGFDGFIANATIGVNIYLGKQKQHCDWAYTPCFPDMSYLEVENKKKDSLINNLKLDLTDSDGDGVINYSDDERDTPLGNKVNCRGVSLKNIDSDGDGVNDLLDECVDIPGKPEFAGCPEELIAIIKDSAKTSDNNVVKGNDNNVVKGNDNNVVKGNDNNVVKGNDNNVVKGNDNNVVKGNDNNVVKGNDNNVVKGNDNNVVKGNDNNVVKGNDNNVVKGNDNNVVKGNDNNVVKGNDNNVVKGNDNNVVKGNDNNVVKGNDNNVVKGNDNNVVKGNDNNAEKANENLISKEGYSSLGDVNFDLNQSSVKPNFNLLLNEIAFLLKEDKNATILIDGHTDITGEESFNSKLAMQRAESVKRILESKGIASSRIIIGSFGESKPKFSNNSQGGRALNRRVELMIKRD
ncbi:MAG: OmpA family protein [Crocinitomicaceae bacterium]|jgi:outer membrane protein OmpA-like peptidoglycan-associated protein